MRVIAGEFKGRPLKVPREGVRPTSGVLKEALFNICQQEIEGKTFLDLFAGSGAVGLEALSRGALHVTFIDLNKDSLRVLKQNIELLKVEPSTEVLAGDALLKLKSLEKRGKTFDIIFTDPPYETDVSEELLLFFSTSPLLNPSGVLFMEEPKGKQTLSKDTLILKKERLFGDSKLLEYRKKLL
jgi:16S rRNA (guanine(966)-N(2))-methyltransferase RsmD